MHVIQCSRKRVQRLKKRKSHFFGFWKKRLKTYVLRIVSQATQLPEVSTGKSRSPLTNIKHLAQKCGHKKLQLRSWELCAINAYRPTYPYHPGVLRPKFLQTFSKFHTFWWLMTTFWYVIFKKKRKFFLNPEKTKIHILEHCSHQWRRYIHQGAPGNLPC